MTLRLPKLAPLAALLTVAALALTGCSSQSYPPVKAITTSSVGVQMFMWPYKSLATECSFLGEAGYDWVLVSPPQEHIEGTEWWAHYQPVSYKIKSSLGTEKQFKTMLSSCKDAGVEVVVDAVINHMTGQNIGGMGFAGTKYGKYTYPGLYTNEDFHGCPTGVESISDWSNVEEIQQCELLGLSDLDTGKSSVRDKIANYLKMLRSWGVAGFRIDAAKHMAASEVKQIKDQLPADTFWVNEVIGDTPPQSDYYAFSSVFSFDWVSQMMSTVGNPESLGGSADPSYFEGMSPSNKTVTMVSNHDTERNGGALTYLNGAQFDLASQFTLAVPYGMPMMYSGYAFSDTDMGPDIDGNAYELPATCVANPSSSKTEYNDLEWVCQHRWAGIVGMIAFRHAVGNAKVENQFESEGAYGFSRGDKGFVLFNTSNYDFAGKVPTGMAAGDYIDRISGKVITVAQDGTIDAKLGTWSSLAFDVKSKK